MDEISKMQTPWDSDKILMVDIGCAERGCMGVETSWAGGDSPECRAMQEYKEWVGLTKDEIETLSYKAEGNTWTAIELAEAKLKEKNT
jgi:hypothetical protein